ncbi:MAG: YfhO family protein [Planctomycetes bacterium]|nr:YfhO family protein [Planctomycetota bacterium]
MRRERVSEPSPSARQPNDVAQRGTRGSQNALALAAIAACVAFFLWDSLFAARAFLMRDTIYDFIPWRRFAADAAREGSVPLWNPYSRFGQPFVANPQSAFFYPPHHLFDLLPVRWALAGTIALHLFIAAAGMFALLRRFGLVASAAMLGGIVFAFGTYFTANLEFMSVMDTLAWAPLTILLVCRVGDAVRGGSPPSALRRAARPVVLLASVVAMQVLAGQAQVLVYTAFAALVYAVAVELAERRRAADRGAHRPRTDASAPRTLALLAAAAVLAAGLSLVQLLPSLDLVPHSVRAAGVDPGLEIASMPARHLATLIFPLAFGRPGANEWWSPSLFEFWLGCLHVGLLPLACATFAALPRCDGNRTVSRAAAASAALCVIGVLIAMGKHAPVYGLLQSLPGTDKVRWPAKGLQLTAIGLAALAGIGFDGLLARRDAARAAGRHADRATLILVGAWSAVAVLVVFVGHSMGPRLFQAIAGAQIPATQSVEDFLARDFNRAATFLALASLSLGAVALCRVPRRPAVAIALTLAFGNLFLVSRDVQFVGDAAALTPPAPLVPAPPSGLPGHVHTAYYQAGFQVYGARDAASYALAASLLAGEVGMPDRVSSTYGGDALQVARVVDVVDLLDSAPPAVRTRLADVLAVDREIRGAPFDEILARGVDRAPKTMIRPQALPRAFVADEWLAIDDRVDAMQRLLSPGFDFRRAAIEDGSSGAPPLPPSPAATGAGPSGRVTAVRPGRDRVDVDVRADRACLLVLCETWLPGWTATVDGVDTPVRRVNVIFRGVPLPAGAQRVSFVYAPQSFRTGAIGSMIALVIALAMWLRGRPLTT